MSLGLAFRCFFRALRDPKFSEQVEPLLAPPRIEEKRPNGDLVRLLGLLQRDARLLDFIQEDIAGYSDEEVGAAVRDIHRDCQAVIARYLELAPVVDKPEEEPIEVPEGFDPNEIRLTGNVKGSPPFKGTLAHRGWKVVDIKIGDAAEGSDPLILAPAEVEVP